MLYNYGPNMPPGKNTIRLTMDGKSNTSPMEMKLYPRVKVERADRQNQFDLGSPIRDELNRVYNAASQIEDVRTQVNGLMKRLVGNDSTKPVLQAAGDLDQKLLATRDNLIQLKIKANEDSLAYPQRADSKLAYLGLLVSDDTDSAPTEAEYQEFDKLKKQTDEYLAHWGEPQNTDMHNINIPSNSRTSCLVPRTMIHSSEAAVHSRWWQPCYAIRTESTLQDHAILLSR